MYAGLYLCPGPSSGWVLKHRVQYNLSKTSYCGVIKKAHGLLNDVCC